MQGKGLVQNGNLLLLLVLVLVVVSVCVCVSEGFSCPRELLHTNLAGIDVCQELGCLAPSSGLLH